MADLSILEAHEVIKFSEHLLARLKEADGILADKRGMRREKLWLTHAVDVLEDARAPVANLLEQVRLLPDLVEVREELAEVYRGRWVDALEKLHAGITFHASSRAPVIEALFPHLKFATLRKGADAVVEKYAAELERRLNGTYVKRILGQADMAFAGKVVAAVATAYERWKHNNVLEPLSAEEAAGLEKAWTSLGAEVDCAIRQARLLAEAALVPVEGAFEEAGLSAKPKRRSGKPKVALDATPESVAEEAPVEPTAAEPVSVEEPETIQLPRKVQPPASAPLRTNGVN